MTSGLAGREDLPDTTAVALPPTRMLRRLRPAAQFIIRRWLTVRMHGAANVPSTGGVILASNHVGLIDGPMLAAFSPRPVHALTKQEMFEGRLGGFLQRTGQIKLNRLGADPSAMKTCLKLLREGRVVGIFPEGTRGGGDLGRFHGGAAYLALVSGAPVVPVTMLGTREPGGRGSSIPRRGRTVEMVYGEPLRLDTVAWPRTREQVIASTLLLREHMLAQLEQALTLTGRHLPGPLPAGQLNIDDDPHTGVVEQGA